MIYSGYFRIQEALSKDDFNGALNGMSDLKKMSGHISDKDLKKEAAAEWRKINADIAKIAENSLKSKDINQVRANFANLSASVYLLAKQFGSSKEFKIKRFHCPMAFDNKGADWLQQSDEAENPYFGAAMYRCGEKTEDIK